MSVSIDRLPKGEVRIKVELPYEEVRGDLTAAANRLAARRSFPGFRPGRVPFEVVAKTVGEQAILEEAIDEVVRRTVVEAVRAHSLRTIGAPHVTVERLAPGNSVAFTATVAVLPEVQLAAYEALGPERPAVTVTEADVDAAVGELRRMLAEERPVDRPAASGDRVELDVDVSIDGVPIEGGKSRNHPALLGGGGFIPGFEAQVLGMRQDETKEFDLTFPKDYHQPAIAGKLGHFRVKTTKVREVVPPPLDEAMAKRAGPFTTLADLRVKLRQNLEQERREAAERQYEVSLIERLIERSTFGELPELLIEHELERMLAELKHDVEEHGLKFPDYLTSLQRDEAALRKELRPRAIHRVQSALVVRAIAEREGVVVSDDDIAGEIRAVKLRSRDDAHHQVDLESDDFRDYTRTVLTNRKAIDALKAKQPARTT